MSRNEKRRKLSYGGSLYMPMLKCSNCGDMHEGVGKYYIPKEYEIDYPSFCPNCGADMRGDQNDKN